MKLVHQISKDFQCWCRRFNCTFYSYFFKLMSMEINEIFFADIIIIFVKNFIILQVTDQRDTQHYFNKTKSRFKFHVSLYVSFIYIHAIYILFLDLNLYVAFNFYSFSFINSMHQRTLKFK